MAKKAAPVITPEQLEAGVQRNENEYIARVQALRAMHEQGTYNPPSDPAVLAKQASEAMRGATGGPAMNPARDNTFNLRDRAPDRQAESMAKSKGWEGHAKVEEERQQESEEVTDARGDAQVQTRNPSQFFGQEGNKAISGGGNRSERIGAESPHVEVYPATSKEEAEAQLATFTGPDVISATIRVKYSVVVVRE